MLPSRSEVLSIAELTGYPAVHVAGVKIQGADGWQRALAPGGLAPPQRRDVLRSPAVRRGVLLCTEEGRAHVRAWRELPPEERPAVTTRENVQERLLLIGDSGLLEPLTAVFIQLPRLVRDILLRNTVWLGVGAKTSGWVVRCNLSPEPRIIITVEWPGDRVFPRVAKHEAAHAFHSRLTSSLAWPVTYQLYTEKLAREQGKPMLARESKEERIARACEIVWGTT